MTNNGIKIVHLSDLHIGMKGASGVWKTLSNHLIQKIKPKLVLITGDIADSPEKLLFEKAGEFFEALKTAGIECLVCAGNHDRHVQGIATDAAPKKIKLIANWYLHKEKENQPRDLNLPSTIEDEQSASLFDQTFSNLGMLSPSIDKSFSDETKNSWRIRIVTLDSSIESKVLAQGHVSPESLANFRNAAQYNGDIENAPHLVIALIHHHLLPITELEAGDQALGDIKKATTILNNAGSVLKALAEVDIDLVFHGHEHCHHLARFGLVSARNDEVLIVGAGSATGALTGVGCDVNRSSFNIFYLQKDRSVWFERMKYSGGTWALDGEKYELLSSKQVRQSCYMRHNFSDKALPQSQQERHFMYTFSRDAQIRETRTNWLIENNEFSVKTGNSSGTPYFMRGVVKLTSEEPIELDQYQDMCSLGTMEYQYTKKLPSLNGRSVLNYTEHEIVWLAGGVLTKADLLRCDERIMESLRKQGKEFVMTFVEQSLKSLSMFVELPEKYAPKSTCDFEVLTGKLDSKSWELNPELTKRLIRTGKEKIRLDIPYPFLGYCYVITWFLPDLPDITLSSTDQIRKRDKLKNTEKLAKRIVDDVALAIKSLLPDISISIALYCPTIKNSHLAFECLEYTMTQDDPKPWMVIEPKYNGHPFCSAHWGVSRAVDKSDEVWNEAGLHEDEHALFAIPLELGQMTESLAIVRVGWLSKLTYENQALDSFNLIDAAVRAGSACALLELIGE